MSKLGRRYIALRLVLGAAAFVYFATLISLQITLLGFPKELFLFPSNLIVFTGLCFTLWSATRQPQELGRKSLVGWILGTALLLNAPFYLSGELFGTTDFGSILISVEEIEIAELFRIGASDFGGKASQIAIGLSFFFFCGRLLGQRVQFGREVVLITSVGLILFGPITMAIANYALPNKDHDLISAESDIVGPQILSGPLNPPNLVMIYLESLERTYRDTKIGTTSFAQLSEIEDAALSFRNISQFPGMEFTIGGIVASQCGVPLYPRGMFAVGVVDLDIGAGAQKVYASKFLGSVDCLGDVLSRRGYTASYMNGSSLATQSKGQFFSTHGFERLFGLENAVDFPPSQLTSWGLPDQFLFEKAQLELSYLVAEGSPFFLSMLSNQTHGPNGFPDPHCDYGLPHTNNLALAIHCTGSYVAELLAYIDSLGISDHTVVVVLSDHLAMRNSLYDLLQAQEPNRRNFAAILAPGRKGIVWREGSPMDLYPTILEVMGYEIYGGRANLGRSLIGPEPTLSESVGPLRLANALYQNNRLQRFLWKVLE